MWLLRLHEIIISPTTIWLLFPAIDSSIPPPPPLPPLATWFFMGITYVIDCFIPLTWAAAWLVYLLQLLHQLLRLRFRLRCRLPIAIVVAVALLRLPSLHMRRDLAANYPCNTYANLRTCNSEACRYTHYSLTAHSLSHTHCHTCSCCVHGNQLRLNNSNKTWGVWDVAMKYVIRVVY